MASSEITGDFRELEALAKKLSGLATPLQRAGVNKALAVRARAEVEKGFIGQRDPCGHPWPPLRSREGKALRDTGQLMNGFRVFADATGFSLRAGKAPKLVAPHQYGAVIVAKGKSGVLRFRVGGPRPRSSGAWRSKHQVTIPRRQMVPEVTLGPIWTAALQATADKWLEVELQKTGPKRAA